MNKTGFEVISVKLLPDGLAETMYPCGILSPPIMFVCTTRSSGSSWTAQGETYLPGTREFRILSKRVIKKCAKSVADMKFIARETASFVDYVATIVGKTVHIDIFMVGGIKLSRVLLRPGACAADCVWDRYTDDGVYFGCGVGIPHIALENRLAALHVERIASAVAISAIFSSIGAQDLCSLFSQYYDVLYPES